MTSEITLCFFKDHPQIPDVTQDKMHFPPQACFTTYLLFSVTEDLIPEEYQTNNTCLCCKSVYPK